MTFKNGLHLIIVLVSVVAGCGLAYAAVPGDAVTLSSLLEEMTELERLTHLPSPAYTTRQFSSYDPKSTDPAQLTEENWFANYDRNQHLRVEDNAGCTEYVLMDAAGPGAVVRFWSANPKEGGIVRFYLDHAEEPVIEMPLYVFLSGTTKPFIAPISGERGKGWNCYMPIPYAEHCKITLSEGDIYYHINYRTYASGTSATSFSFGQAEALAPQIRAMARALDAPFDAVSAPGGMKSPYTAFVDAGRSESLFISGPGAINSITCQVKAENIDAALRGCVLTIAFDDNEPAVVAPLGDFFGTAPGLNPYQSLPSGVLEDGLMYSRWVMPFKDGAEITVENHTGFDVELQGEVGFMERPWTEDSLYFHAKWRAEKDIATRPMKDWNYLTAGGKGRFAGVMLHVTNPVVQWWGEGDEKIYVDGEPFPSHFGTGTEDYYGYAWCDTTLFSHAYHNQIRCDGPDNFGQTCVSRFHIMDDIPFTQSFRFDLEVWHWADTAITQSVCAYWYAAPGAEDAFAPIEAEWLTVPELPELPQPKQVEGAVEAETMKIISLTGSGEATVQDSSAWPWSGGKQLWWKHGAPGDVLTLCFNAEKAGVHEVIAVFTKAADYGIHRLSVNDQDTGDSMDFYNKDGVTVTEEISLGAFDLHPGENFLKVRIEGSNPDAEAAYMFGLDYVRLVMQ